MNRNLSRIISTHTTQWFQHEKSDSISPALSVKQFNELFLNACNRLKLTLTCTEKEFKNFMCEATCTMYIANKRGTTWRGPLSEAPRPRKWSSALESQWLDYIRFYYFTADTWHNLWSQIPEGMWERAVPDWRIAMEHIVYHYIECQPHKLDDYSSGGENDGGNSEDESPQFHSHSHDKKVVKKEVKKEDYDD